jgi:hypothetical protein
MASEVHEGEVLEIDEEEAGREVALTGVDAGLAAALTGIEIDRQIATARRFPRSLKVVTDRIYQMATLDKESAQESVYALPRGKGADRKAIIGPSIRFAEVLAQSFGNCRDAARVVAVNREEMYVEAEGVFHDLETNRATSARIKRPIRDSKGRLYSEDMIIVTGNAACSIAKRNAILGGVPKPLWRRAFEAVLQTNRGDLATLSERRQEAVKAFAFYGVAPDQVFSALGVNGGEDITLDHVVILRGMFAALKNEEATVEQLFPPARSVIPQAQPNTALTDRLKSAKAEGAEGFTAAQAEGRPAGEQLDQVLGGDQIPGEGGAKPPPAGGAEASSDYREAAESGGPGPSAPKQTLSQRIAAWKTLVDEETDTVKVMRLLKDAKPLLADVDKGDADEVGTSADLEAYANDRCRQIEGAAS